MEFSENYEALIISCCNCKTNIVTFKKAHKGICPKCKQGFLIVDKDENAKPNTNISKDKLISMLDIKNA